MKIDGIVCDGCGTAIQSPAALHWEKRPSVFALKFPRDGVNGGDWNMDVCAECREKLFDAITGTIDCLRTGKPQQ